MTEEQDAPHGLGVYDRLLAEIRQGILQPGMRLRETEIAERLGISRTPVREAIRALEADGLVTHQPRQGATLRRLRYAEIVELYEMRAVLEGTAARLAARAAMPVEIDQIAALNAELAAAATPEVAYVLNQRFHRILAEAARNRFLIRAMSTLQKTLLILGRTTLADDERVAGAVREHEAVIAALRSGDGNAAELAMRAHVEAALAERIRDFRAREIPMEEDE